VVALIPYIREFIRRHLNSKQAVMLTEFDKLKRVSTLLGYGHLILMVQDYQEHQNEIHAKLVAIMSDRLSVHVAALRVSRLIENSPDDQDIDWEATDKAAPHPYAEMLVKETATLHKVLSKYLAASTVENVLAEVLGAIVARLSEEYGKVELKSDEAKKR
jgi:vacuolar protein sorting-associated protein 54